MDAFIKTYSGKKFWAFEPNPEDVSLEDIAHALAHKCRYNGHCIKFYSVAEHSVHVSRYVPTEHERWGLLHDGEEAFSPFGDIPRPFKENLPPSIAAHVLGINEKIQQAICQRFDLEMIEPQEVKHVDTRILMDEGDQLMLGGTATWGWKLPKLGVDLSNPLSPDAAKELFLARAAELGLK
jgi:hypothetical protein